MSLALVRSGYVVTSAFFRTPFGGTILLFLIEAVLQRIRKIDHPAAKVFAGVFQVLIALRSVDNMRVWLAMEIPKLRSELARLTAQHSELKALIEVIINAVNRPA
jgi:hypothetical protein